MFEPSSMKQDNIFMKSSYLCLSLIILIVSNNLYFILLQQSFVHILHVIIIPVSFIVIRLYPNHNFQLSKH